MVTRLFTCSLWGNIEVWLDLWVQIHGEMVHLLQLLKRIMKWWLDCWFVLWWLVYLLVALKVISKSDSIFGFKPMVKWVICFSFLKKWWNDDSFVSSSTMFTALFARCSRRNVEIMTLLCLPLPCSRLYCSFRLKECWDDDCFWLWMIIIVDSYQVYFDNKNAARNYPSPYKPWEFHPFLSIRSSCFLTYSSSVPIQ